MKFLPLLWKNLWRRKVRTIFTIGSLFVAFVLFGILMTIRTAFSFGVDIAGLDRLVLIHKVSLIMPLPVSYQARLQTTPGVEVATHNTWFGGVYQVLVMVIVTSSFMKFYTDMIGLSPAIYGVVFLLFSIWNEINDPVIGYWADKRPFLRGRGKYRPLMRWAVPIMGVSVITLLFASPNWNEIVTAVFLLTLLVIYEGSQTLLGVSFMAFTVNTFLSTDERTEVQVISS